MDEEASLNNKEVYETSPFNEDKGMQLNLSKAEKLRVHCYGTDKINTLEIIFIYFLISSLCYLYPDALKSP